MVGSPDPVLYFLSATAVLKFLLSYLNYRSVPKEAKRVGTISRITLFPLKSSRGIDLDAAECTFSGLKMTGKNIYDRRWLVIREDNNRFVTGRQEPKMTTIQPSFHGDCLQLDAPGMEPLKIPQNIDATPANILDCTVWGEAIQGVDCGQCAADWLNQLLSPSRCRLIYCASGVRLRSLASRTDDQWYSTAKDIDEVAYQDAAPFMLLSEGSLADVNKRLPGGVDKVEMDQFRPNFVASGCDAFDEDSWKEVYIGGVKYTNIKKCDRCILTTVNPKTGTKHPDMEPLTTLRRYRLIVPEFEQAPCFGVNFVADRTGDIHVGDEILATN